MRAVRSGSIHMLPGIRTLPTLVAQIAAIAVISSLLALAPASAQTSSQATITFEGGGFGHGVGMSQYGAYGRALAGQTHDQILSFYYEGSTLTDVEAFSDATTNFSVADDVDVRIDIKSRVAVSPPNDQAGSWEIDVYGGQTLIGTSQNSVDSRWDGSRWVAVTNVGGTDVDLCSGQPACAGSTLEFVMSGDERVVMEEFRHGPNFGHFRGGRMILHPAAVPGPKGTTTTLCGSGVDFCVIHGDLDLQTYLYGLAEVPSSWPKEALKAQAVAGRSYAVSRILSRNASSSWQAPFDVYSTTQDQYYTGWEKWLDCTPTPRWCQAVDETNDQVATYNGGIVETYYSASNGGATAEPPDVWAGGTTRPYLKAKADPYDSFANNPYRVRDFTYTIEQVSRWLNSYTPPAGIDPNQLKVGTLQKVIINTGPSGRVTFAEVILVGTERTTRVENRIVNGQVVAGPYGFRFFYALQKGCEAEQAAGAQISCLESTNFRVKGFTDVPPGVYYYEPVHWMDNNDITNGVDGGTAFAPDRDITRAEAATFLWRFMGSPTPQSNNSFHDVPGGLWYTSAVSWMEENGITTGTSDTTFSPMNTITRGQMAAFLWRLAGRQVIASSQEYRDVTPDRYFYNSVAWMELHGITTGTSDTTFSPDDELTRGQIATFIWRLAGVPQAFDGSVTRPNLMRVAR